MVEFLIRVRRAVRQRLARPQWSNGRETAAPRTLEEQIYGRAVRLGDVCYDLGAHVGDVSLLLARLAGAKGVVVACEPVWPTYVQLCRRVQQATGPRAPIVTVPVGLAEVEKVATIQVPSGQFGMGSLAQSDDWAAAQPRTKISSFSCRFTTLDSLVQTSGLPAPDFIKIDVEGAELFVLRGAEEFFAAGRRPLMLIELFAPWERAFEYGPWDVLSLLAGWGYRVLFVCPQGLVDHAPTAAAPFPPGFEQGYNVLAFCPDQHADRLALLAGLRVGGGDAVLPTPPPPVANRL